QFIPSPCFNRVLVDSGHAQVKDFTNNEFTPGDWWASQTVDEVAPEPATMTEAGKYVGSVVSDKYHYLDCRWAEKIKPGGDRSADRRCCLPYSREDAKTRRD
ncbi:MAG: hypothetical protein ACXQT2_04310, partial [Methanotrichaceae archaeon]